MKRVVVHEHIHNVDAAVKKGKKRKGDQKDEVDEYQLNEATRKWCKDRKVVTGIHWRSDIAKHSIPTSYMQRPHPNMAARENMMGHSKDIKHKMLTGGVAEGNITCVIWKQDVQAIGGLETLWERARDDSSQPPIPFHTITGDHTASGAQMALEDQPQRVDLKRMMVTVLMCDKNDSADWEQAHQYGVYDNQLADAHRSHNVWDIVNIMHNFINATKSNFPDDINGKPHPTFVKLLKEKRGIMLTQYAKTAKNTQGSLWVIAQRSGEVWQLIKKIKIGDMETEGSAGRDDKGTQSHGHFVNMSDIPEEVLIKWLKKVEQDSSCKTKWFNDQCLYYKKVMWVKQAILEYALQINPQLSASIKSYDDLAARFRPFSEGQTFDAWVYSCGRIVKAGLPATVKVSIESCLTICLQQEVHNTHKHAPIQNLPK